ncbi:MAG: Sec-independent protein translocase protein TatB [Granulosicoccus sp.]
MFDVGFTEVFLIGVVSLVVIGPERLPAVAKTAGQWVAKLQRFVRGVKTDLASELESGDLKKLIGDQKEQIDELRKMVSTTKKEFQSTAKTVMETTREGLSELETSVNEAKADVGKVSESLSDETHAADVKPGADDTTAPGTVDIAKSASEADSADVPPAKRTGTNDSDSQ